MKISCPRCDSSELRAKERRNFIVCRRCGYEAHWRQFFPGTREREEVRKLFDKGEIEGKEVIKISE